MDALAMHSNARYAPPMHETMPASRRRATSYDVARAVGVAQSTVSRCFRDDGGISPETRARVLEMSRTLGYTPNALARGLITQRSDMVGVVITRYTLRGSPDVVYAIGESLKAAGKTVLLITVEADFPPLTALRRALEYPLDGLVSCVLFADDDLRQLQARRLPMVFYNRSPERIPADWVAANHFFAAADAASALYAAGHRNFLCVGGPPTALVSRQRIDGFMTRLTGLGVTPPPVLDTDYSYAGGHAAFLARCRAGDRPDAVFCANDQLAMAVMDASRFTLGWRVPEDLSVVGFDDIAEAGRATYDLTTLRQDTEEMARQAVRLLLLRLADPAAAPATSLVPATLIRRRSARLPGV
jgi:DNA-binding LacI/PurR family transcriptional regulator